MAKRKKKKYDVIDVMKIGWDDLHTLGFILAVELTMLLIFIVGSPLYLIGLIHLKLIGGPKK